MSRQLAAAVLLALAVWAASTQVAQPTFTAEAFSAHALAAMTATIGWAVILGLGRILARALPGGWLHQGVLGFLGAVAVLLPMGAAGLIGPIPLAVLAAVGLGGWLLPAPPLPDRDAWMGPVAIGAFALLVPGLLIALAPPTDTDELFWHLAAPTRLLREGHLPGGWADPVASRPLPLQLVYAALMAVGGPEAAKLFHWGGAALLLAGIYGVTRERGGPAGAAWAVALLAGSWTFLEDAGLAHDNLPVALLVLASLDAALRADPVRMGLAAGAALSVKYTAAPAVAAVWLVLAWAEFREGRLARSLLAPLIAALPIAPWWARNLLDGLHPLFPYAGWPTHGGLVYAWPQKYGAGHDLVALLRLPVDLVFAARTDSFVFLGRLHPAWLLSAPLAVWAAVYDGRVRGGPSGPTPMGDSAGVDRAGDPARIALVAGTGNPLRVLLGASVVGLVGWWLGVQWMRHLLPLAPVIAVMLGLAVSRAPASLVRMGFAAWALLLPAQVLDHVARAGAVVPVVTGATPAADWYRANLPAWPAIEWVNTYTPPDARVAFLFTGETALVDRTVVLGSVEDHTPTRWLAFAHGDDALGWLRDQGVTYVVVQRVGFIRKPYPFLSEAEFRAQFTDPETKIRDLLLDQGRLVFESKRHSVWALDAPTTGG